MTGDLRLLIVTKRPTLADTIRHHLRAVGFAPSVSEVATEAAYHHCLQESFDLVIVDAALARPDPFRCLHIIQQRLSVPPLIVVGDHLSPQAVAYVREGAADFLLSHNLERIGEAFTQAQSRRRRRRRLPETMHAHSEEIAVLYKAAQELGSTLDLDEILQRILHNVGQVVDYDGVNIMLIEDGVAKIVSCYGYYEDHGLTERLMEMRLPVNEIANLRRIVKTGEPVLINNTAEDPGWESIEVAAWVRACLTVPIRYEQDVIGFLSLDAATPGFFTTTQMESLQTFADHAATALRNARLYQTLQAYSDYLEEAVAERTVELQRAVDRMEVILDNSPGGVLLLQANGRIETGNSAVRDIFGYPLYELFGQKLHFLVAPAEQDKVDHLLRHTLDRGQEQRAQIVARRADGTIFDVELALAPVRENGRVVSVVCNLFDISALKEVERMKDAFVSNVSHELRTPISSLKLYHGLLARRPENWDIYMACLEREIDRLNVIIEDLLRLSRLEQGRVDLTQEMVDLNHLVEQYVVDRLPLAQRDNLVLTLSPTSGLSPIPADPGLLGQVLSIILTNAFAYTPAGQAISVGTRQRHGGGRHWVGFYVKDTGPGIPAEELPLIFDRFYRGTVGRNSGTAGTGLGLSIAREIVTRHNGRIDVTSQTGDDSGTTFTVWLPV